MTWKHEQYTSQLNCSRESKQTTHLTFDLLENCLRSSRSAFHFTLFFGATFTVKHLFNNCGGVVLVFWTSKEKNTSRRCFQLPSFLIRFSWAVFFFQASLRRSMRSRRYKNVLCKIFGAEGSMANCNALGNGWGKRCMCAWKVKNLRSWSYFFPSWSNIVCVNFKNAWRIERKHFWRYEHKLHKQSMCDAHCVENNLNQF